MSYFPTVLKCNPRHRILEGSTLSTLYSAGLTKAGTALIKAHE